MIQYRNDTFICTSVEITFICLFYVIQRNKDDLKTDKLYYLLTCLSNTFNTAFFFNYESIDFNFISSTK